MLCNFLTTALRNISRITVEDSSLGCRYLHLLATVDVCFAEIVDRRKSKPKLWSPKITRCSSSLFLLEWQIAQRERSVEEETGDGPAVRRNAAKEDDDYHLQFSHLRYLRPRTDVLRFNRAQVMEKIVKSIDLSRPAHRHGKHLDEWCVPLCTSWLWHRIGQKVWHDDAFTLHFL